jgi:hypothetical protein
VSYLVSEWLNTSEIIDNNAKKPCHRLEYCPYGKLVEEFPVKGENSGFNCKAFHHDCPIFYHIEYTSENYRKEDYEKEVDFLYKKGGLSEVFSKDKIAEYWYNIGSAHSDDDYSLKLQYIIEKLIIERPEQKDILLKLKELVQSVSLEEIYKWDSHR